MRHDPLRRDLQAIATRAAAALRGERRRRRLRPAMLLSCAGAAVLAAGAVLAVLAGIPAGRSPARYALLAAIVFASVVVFVATVLRVRAASRDESLAEADRRFGLQDRLRTAAEFLDRTGRTSFMEAALLDAAPHAGTYRLAPLPVEAAPGWFPWRTRFTAAGALVLLVLLGLVQGRAVPAGKIVRRAAGSGPRLQAEHETAEEPREAPPEPRDQEDPAATPAARRVAPSSSEGREDARLDASVKKSRGAMGSGLSADASASSGTSEARGAPSSQAQASKPGKKPTKKKKVEPKQRKKPDSEPVTARKPEDDSGATAGRGAASGSNKSPSASPWSSKDQVTSEDEEELEEDEEVDDEFDDSDARGGVQPHLRDRRPPVNRDLGIGFGNSKNPDANGRGGPSEMKKSRGVASLVLGVPIPDHVKGRPNPGKTKITQERVEPKVEDARPAEATARRPRNAPVGHLADPELRTWMRDLIRGYFKAIRPDPSKSEPTRSAPTRSEPTRSAPTRSKKTEKPGD